MAKPWGEKKCKEFDGVPVTPAEYHLIRNISTGWRLNYTEIGEVIIFSGDRACVFLREILR